jgi:hypothetical protein
MKSAKPKKNPSKRPAKPSRKPTHPRHPQSSRKDQPPRRRPLLAILTPTWQKDIEKQMAKIEQANQNRQASKSQTPPQPSTVAK